MTYLLQYFPQLSLRPENLPELRSLILQLAVEGKLTAEWRKANPDVEPASELLARIEAEKAALVKAKQIKKSKSLPPVRAEEMPFELPEGWVWCHLEETGFTQTGSTPPKKESSYFGDYIPFISPAHISNEKMRYPKEGLSEKGLSKGRLITNGSLLMVCIGGSIGKCNITDRDVSCNQQINTLTPVINNSSYIKIACQASYFQNAVVEKSGGSATPIINKRKWESLTIPLPPLPEQQAIVQTVDALLQELDQLQQRTETRLQLKVDYATAALRRLTTAPAVGPAWEALSPHFRTFFDETGNVQSLRAAILQLAVQGKLTAQWRKAQPDVEPATELLSRIQAEKAALVKAKKIKKEKPLPQVDAAEVPFGVPEGWVWCRLGEVVELISGHHIVAVDYNDSKDGIPYLTGPSDFGDLNPVFSKWTEKPKVVAKNEDILITVKGSGVGKINILHEDEVAIGRQLMAIRNLWMPVSYVYLFLKSDYQNIQDQKVGIAIPGISRNDILNKLFPLPSLSEQHAIVQAVEELLGLCTALEDAAGRRDVVLGDWVRAVVAGG